MLLLLVASSSHAANAAAKPPLFVRLLDPGYEDIRDRCLIMANVCVDQGTFVLYDPQYRPDADNHVPLPRFKDWETWNWENNKCVVRGRH